LEETSVTGRLANEVVLVTGAARGIGRAVAFKAAEEGAAVALVDILADPLTATTAELAETGATMAAAVGDITDEVSVRQAVGRLTDDLGRQITVLVNNAGKNSYADPARMSVAEWDDVFDVDLNIRVNAVSPGYISTDLLEEFFDTIPGERERALGVHPLGRIGTPENVAEVVCFLASEAAAFVTGANWAVDGGLGVRYA
jgi:NAD(P)-dependent dehydrogenase (short-subunit alcohol dehydrogenase family)